MLILRKGKFWTAQVETFMSSAEREPITGDWWQSPQRQSPWSGGQGAKPPEADSILAFER